MQTCHFENLPLRARYYQSMIDYMNLEKAKDYKALPASYVLFICTDDPFSMNRPKYVFKTFCQDNKDLELKDKVTKVFYNASSWNLEDNLALKEFLSFVNSQTARNDFTWKLISEVNIARQKEKWREEYMVKSLWEMDIRSEAEELAMERGLKRGIEQGKLQTAIEAILNFNIPPEKAAEVFHLPLDILKAELENKSAK